MADAARALDYPEIALSVIIPAYHEAHRLGRTLDDLAAFLDGRPYGPETEVVVVAAESPDGTVGVAMSRAHLFPHFRVVDAGPRVGKGRDTRVGIMEARGRCRLYMDADLATPLRYIDDVVRLSDRGAKLGTAVRDLKSSHKGLRRLISLIGNVLVQMLLLPGVHDSQCGFKFFEAGVAEELFGRQTVLGWGFDMEILAIARLRGHRIETIEAPDWLDVPGGSFHQSAVRGTIETLRDLFAIKLKLLFGRYRRPTFVYEAFRPGEVASVSAVPAPRVAR